MSEQTAVDQCEQAIRRSIVRGQLAAGDRLPPERQLAERLGVNRTTLRAALSRLASERLLEVRQGSGYVVQDMHRVAGLALLPEIASMARERGEGLAPLVADLLEVRRRLATMVFERIAARRDPTLAEPVSAAVDRFEEAARRPGATLSEIAEADLEVTSAMLEATGSEVLALCLNPVSHVVERLEPLRNRMYRRPEENVLAYRLVIEWLRDPRPERITQMVGLLAQRDVATVEALQEADSSHGGAGPTDPG